MPRQPTVIESWVRLIRTYADAVAVTKAVMPEENRDQEIDRYAMMLMLKARIIDQYGRGFK